MMGCNCLASKRLFDAANPTNAKSFALQRIVRHCSSNMRLTDATATSAPRIAEDRASSGVSRPIIRLPVIHCRWAVERMRKMKNYLTVSDVRMHQFDYTPIVKCRRAALNHLKGQSYDEKVTALPLASQHWNSHRSIGDYFSIEPHDGPPFDTDQENATFADFIDPPLDARLVERLRICDFVRTSFVQHESIPQLLNGGDHLITADTGSGKTLTYVVPLIHQAMYVKSVEQHAMQTATSNKVETAAQMNCRKSPLSIVVVPSRELAAQVHQVITNIVGTPMSNVVDYDSTIIDVNSEKVDGLSNTGSLDVKCQVLGGVRSREMSANSSPADILIGTPGTLAKAMLHGQLSTYNVNHLVLDETATLLDDTFLHTTLHVMQTALNVGDAPTNGKNHRHNIVGRSVQLTMVGSTLPRLLDEKLESVLNAGNELTQVITKRAHDAPHHIRQTFIRTPKIGKSHFLLDILRCCVKNGGGWRPSSSIAVDNGKRGGRRKRVHGPPLVSGSTQRIIVFSNKATTATYVSRLLQSHNFVAPAFHSNMSLDERRTSLATYMAAPQNKNDVVILSCTDLASRGIDTAATDLIINYECPLNLADYLLRVGRTGRIGSPAKGQVITFVGGYIPVEITQTIESAVRRHRILPSVDGNVIRIIRKRAGAV